MIFGRKGPVLILLNFSILLEGKGGLRVKKKRESSRFYLMFRSGIDLGGKACVLKVGLLAWLALLRCQRSLNSLVKCATSRLLLNWLWTHQKRTYLRINEPLCSLDTGPVFSHIPVTLWEPLLLLLSWKQQNKGLILSGSVPHPSVSSSSSSHPDCDASGAGCLPGNGRCQNPHEYAALFIVVFCGHDDCSILQYLL